MRSSAVSRAPGESAPGRRYPRGVCPGGASMRSSAVSRAPGESAPGRRYCHAETPARPARYRPGRREIGRLARGHGRSEEHTSELQSLAYLVCRLLLEKKKKKEKTAAYTNHKRCDIMRGALTDECESRIVDN